MNAVVWWTFALVVLVAPAFAAGTGLVVGRTRRPLAVAVAAPMAAPVAVPAPAVELLAPQLQPERPRVAIEPRPGNRWAVQKEGARRASRVFDRKDDAVAYARTLGDVAVAA
jgi:hypothetical protein